MKPKGFGIISPFVIVCLLAVTGPHVWAKQSRPVSNEQALELAQQGILKANAGNLRKAIELFDASLKASGGKNVKAFLNRGKVSLLQGHLDRALQDLDKAIKLDPEGADAYVVRGTIHRLRGDFSKAVKDLNKAVSLNPDNTDALTNRAAVFFDTGEHEKALVDLGKIIQLNPRMIRALGNRAYIFEQLGRYDDAIKDLSVIVAQDPNHLMAIKHLGFIYRQKKEPEKAARWYRMALKLENDQTARRRLAEEIVDLEKRIPKH
ncbi:MAG: tetratricopeptide repeat protein [Desulfomonilaceae bacterium]